MKESSIANKYLNHSIHETFLKWFVQMTTKETHPIGLRNGRAFGQSIPMSGVKHQKHIEMTILCKTAVITFIYLSCIQCFIQIFALQDIIYKFKNDVLKG